MVFWQKFDPEQFDFEFDEDELAKHGITIDEVVEVIWNGFEVVGTNASTVAIRLLALRMAAEA